MTEKLIEATLPPLRRNLANWCIDSMTELAITRLYQVAEARKKILESAVNLVLTELVDTVTEEIAHEMSERAMAEAMEEEGEEAAWCV